MASQKQPRASMVPGQASTLTRILEGLASLVWWSLFVVLVLFALYGGLGRQLTANIDQYSDQLARELSDRTGLEVSIGRLSARWQWLDPAVSAEGVSVRYPGAEEAIVDLEYLSLRLDSLTSLFRFRLVFEDFEADGLSVTLERTAGLDVQDLPEDLGQLIQPGNTDVQHWITLAGQWLSDPQVTLTRVALIIDNGTANPRQLDIPQLDLLYHRGLFQASGRAMQPGTVNQLASFALVGQQFFRGQFTGQLYLDIDSGRLFDGLVDDLSWRGLRLEGFDLGGRAWLTFDKGQLEQVQGTVTTPYLQLGVYQASLAPLENIRARFGWRRNGAIQLRQLQWQWLDETAEPFELRLQPDSEDNLLIADNLPLQPISKLLQALPLLPRAIVRELDQYQPSGYLDDLVLRLPENLAGFRLSGQLRDISVAGAQGTPSVNGLHGRLDMTANKGRITLDKARPVQLGFPLLFASEWQLDTLTGSVFWQLNGDITRVFADELKFQYQQKASFRGTFDLRLDASGEDNLGLKVAVENADAPMLADFVPVHAVDADLYQWLTTAIREVNIRAGEYYGHGRVDEDAPNGSFTSAMWYEFDQGRVVFDQSWPEASSVRGRVEIQNAHTRVELAEAHTGGLKIEQGLIRVSPEDANGPPRIRIDTSTTVPGENIQFWLTNSPLGEITGLTGDELEFLGSYGLGLMIDMPLSGNQVPDVVARVRPNQAELRYPAAGLVWHNIEGDLSYHSRSGFSGGPLSAEFLGQSVQVSLQQITAENARALAVSQTGQLPMPGFLQQFGISAGSTPGLSGTLNYQAEAVFEPGATPLVSVNSDLKGLVLDWPPPLGKSPEQLAPLSAQIDTTPEQGVRITGHWQNRADFSLLWKNSGFELDLDSFSLVGQALDGVHINALNLGDRWVVHTRSERAEGQVILPDEGVISVDLEHFRLLRAGQQAAARNGRNLLTLEQQLEAFQALDMGDWPDIDVRIADLQLGETPAGRWQFQLRPQPMRLNIRNIAGQLQTLELKGDMSWSLVNERETTRFTGALSGRRFRELEALTGSPIPLDNEQTHAELDLHWPGRPDEFAMHQLSGNISLRLDDGVILEQNGSAQLFRIFNLLNTDTLLRRLRLDFSDLYERGIAFDAISGKARILNGLLTLDPELQLVGPSAAFKLSGSTDMDDETLDMKLVLVLPVTQNLPLAAILMGASAPIGGALFVLDKILGDPLSRLTSASYRVTGSWDEPMID